MDGLRHNDCRHFTPVDVAKGICQRLGEIVLTDSQVCGEWVKMPKCKYCNHYQTSQEDGVGVCRGLGSGDWTYGDLAAVTCEGYQERNQ